MTKIINGKKLAIKLKESIKNEITNLKKKYKRSPGLAVVQVGNIAASSIYVKAKTKSAREVGIRIFDSHLKKNISEKKLLNIISKLNKNKKIDGILVQLPLPKQIDEQKILNYINPEKDADGFHPINVGKLSISNKINNNLLIPCTPYGCLLMLKSVKENLAGKNAIILGRSNIVGKPMAQLLIKESCTVTIAHSKTKNLPIICQNADIVIAAIGKPEKVKGKWIKKNAIVIDVGINRIQKKINNEIKNKIVGDVNYKEAQKKARAISPVPGGVGPMTIACLLRNTTTAFKNSL
ncbi:MAG: Bifunctional protein FolD protein [Alphaproteobacteria bacterium MarineAlpha5_Bin9]|nr:MAG: Bifunctional protein FolD protein [Alphaproteobacteria bacterium MarineAlpha5_Bin9]|tara:strand:- start:36957 stop:37838 length:882 start_codon:yes stop_codon:yes gene_type:complete